MPPSDPRTLGVKWLKFWTYVGVPVGTLLAFMVSFDLPRFRYENIAIALLCAIVAFGLHKRKLWAWQWNWVVIGLIYVAMLVPLPVREFGGSLGDFVARGAKELISMQWTRDSLGDLLLPFAVRLILASLLWLWPNVLYWKKRATLFS